MAVAPWFVSDELWDLVEPMLPKRERRFRYTAVVAPVRYIAQARQRSVPCYLGARRRCSCKSSKVAGVPRGVHHTREPDARGTPDPRSHAGLRSAPWV